MRTRAEKKQRLRLGALAILSVYLVIVWLWYGLSHPSWPEWVQSRSIALPEPLSFAWAFWLSEIPTFLVLWFLFLEKARVVARATFREAIRQPIFLLMLFISLAILVLNTFVPFFSLGDDVKMLKDCGLATILIASLLLAVWTASTGISAEIEGKTTMTLLSKPLNRRQFIVGKYFGILQAVLLLMIPLLICFLMLIYYKVGYDARESGQPVPAFLQWTRLSWLPFNVPKLTPLRWQAVVQVMPALVLIFFEAAILTALGVAIATRAPMVVNFVSCLAIYVVGHLGPVLVKVGTQSTVLEIVQFIARMESIILPSLAMFDTQAAVATDVVVPGEYVAWAALYWNLYGAAAILLAFVLFEDRDLS